MKPWGCVGGSRGKPLELPVPWAAGSRRNECVGSYILPWGIPSSSWGPFRLLLSHGPLPSHPSFFAERPTGSCVLPRPRAAGRRRPLSPRPRPPRPGPAPALPGQEAAGPSGSTHPLGHVGGSQSACGARGGGGRGGPWPEVADAPPLPPSALASGYNLDERHVQNLSFPHAGRHFGYRVLQVGTG